MKKIDFINKLEYFFEHQCIIYKNNTSDNFCLGYISKQELYQLLYELRYYYFVIKENESKGE